MLWGCLSVWDGCWFGCFLTSETELYDRPLRLSFRVLSAKVSKNMNTSARKMRKTVQILPIIKKEYPEIELSASAIDRLEDYLVLLHRWNQKTGLTAVREIDQMVVKHVLDSLAIFKGNAGTTRFSRLSGRFMDIGSGAGVPGIVLAIACPAVLIISVEKSMRKIGFQQVVKANLRLPNFEPVSARTETLIEKPDWKQAFDGIVSRAYTQIKRILPFAAVFLKPGGQLYLWKGKSWEDEMQASVSTLADQFRLDDRTTYRFSQSQHGGTILTFTRI
jgi:16S rRNA (guanine527-N7)-methyltransferase